MTVQRNEPDSVERKRGSHLKVPRNVGRTRTNDLSPTGIQFAHVNATAHEASANTRSLSDGPRPSQHQTTASTLTLSLPPELSPNRSSKPQRLSSGAMDHPTSYRSESSTHHSQMPDDRNVYLSVCLLRICKSLLSDHKPSQHQGCPIQTLFEQYHPSAASTVYEELGSGLQAPCGVATVPTR